MNPASLFFFGPISPYSWFAAERIGGLLPAAEWRPVFAGGVFKAAGRTSWGFTDERETNIADCEARARDHGLGAIRWPDPWPAMDVVAGRAALVAGRTGRLEPFALEIMRLAFREGADIADVAVAHEAARRSGVDPGEVEAGVHDPVVKAELRAVTDQAVALGVFGVPTVVVGSEHFWGDDRLEAAAAAAQPPSAP
jgi:2-hydroxychromene-2-carboxylate isomerase